MATEINEIERLLASRIGLDPVSVGSPRILRAARQRMKALGLHDVNAYEHRLRQSESELQSLIEEVVVSESWFFRDERPFQWFREYVRGRWLVDLLRPPLRILSLPCAGGEEPYSIAMTLRDVGLPARRFHIEAVDVSADRLEIARRGVYSANAFRGLDLSFRARYFRKHQDGYELDSSIRAVVQFVQASVLDPQLLEGSPPYDIVFCRNLLIYLKVAARARVLAAIERLLTADGVLFIGHADRLDLADAEPKFTVIGDPACFTYRLRAYGDAPWSGVRRAPQPMSGLTGSASTSPGTTAIVAAGAGEITVPPVSPAAPAISSDEVIEPPLLEQAAALANQGRFDEAVAVCTKHVRTKGVSSTAYYLMGMICQAAGNRQRAEECFHKAVYLDPMHDEALLALALLAERRGDNEKAEGFRRRAERSVAVSRKRVN